MSYAGKLSTYFALGESDRRRALTIDPVLNFSTILGGGYSDAAGRIALDSAGNLYVAGTTTSTNFPISPGAIQKTAAEGFCGLITPIPFQEPGCKCWKQRTGRTEVSAARDVPARDRPVLARIFSSRSSPTTAARFYFLRISAAAEAIRLMP